jgi:hypothetical protein
MIYDPVNSKVVAFLESSGKYYGARLLTTTSFYVCYNTSDRSFARRKLFGLIKQRAKLSLQAMRKL